MSVINRRAMLARSILLSVLLFQATVTTRLLVSSLKFGKFVSTRNQSGHSASPLRQPMTNIMSIAHSIGPVMRPWYSDPDLIRSKDHVLSKPLDSLQEKSTRYILFQDGKVLFKNDEAGGGVQPIYFSHDDIERFEIAAGLQIFEQYEEDSCADKRINGVNKASKTSNRILLVFVGQRDSVDYWALHFDTSDARLRMDVAKKEDAHDESGRITLKDFVCDVCDKGSMIQATSLRQFGDKLSSSTDAAVLATANGLVEFHRSHGFCSKCGTATEIAKAGSCRRCFNPGCGYSVYPRIDAAAIMLVTSPCGKYALMGRKKTWPSGRYSTLAGFTEVGETLEESCTREVFEESGVRVDPDSVRFVASQPWPFPRSLMVGFRATAASKPASNEQECPDLPAIVVDEEELEDARWFHREYVAERLSGGSSALDYEPVGSEATFHIPGKSSLARVLITRWVRGD